MVVCAAESRSLSPMLAAIAGCSGLVLSIGPATFAQDFPAQSTLVADTHPARSHTEEGAADGTHATDERAGEDTFHVSFTPYMWLPSLSGDMTVKGAEIDVDSSFLDIVEESDLVFGLMGALEFQFDRIIVQLNGAWTYIEADEERGVIEDAKLKADMTTQTAWFELLGGYRILDRGMAEINDKRRFTFDAFAGARLTIIDSDTDLTLSTDDGSESQSFDDSEIWGEPFIGLRAGIDITERIGLSIRGDVGGFGLGSDISWQFIGAVGYRFHIGHANAAALAGFRALSQDYENGDFKWDVITYGPILGVQFTF